MHLSKLQLRASARYFAAHPGQLGLALLGLALGVAAVVSVGAARATISESFKRFSSQLSGSASHQIVAVSGFIPGSSFVELRRQFADIPMAPVLTFEVRNNQQQALTVMGVDLLRESQLRPFTGNYLSQPDFALADWIGGQPLTLTGAPKGSQIRLDPGDNSEPVLLTVADQLDPALVNGAESLLVMDLSLANRILQRTATIKRPGNPGSAGAIPDLPLSRIDLVYPTGPLLAQLSDALPPGLALKSVNASDTTGMSRALDLNLLALSLLALLVGAFIVFNTLRFFVLQRQQVYAFCRMLGLTRQEVVTWIIAEAALLGLLGTTLGLLLGLWLADLVMAQMAGTVNQLYYEAVSRSAKISPLLWLQAGLLGLLGSLAAALWPALWAARVSPLQQLAPANPARSMGLLMAVGTAALLLAWLIQLSPSLVSALAAVFLVAVGWIAIAIPLAINAAGYAPVSVARFPLIGFARARLPQTLSRTGAALAALVLAVATVIGVDHMISSFRGSVVGWLDVTLSADVYVRNGEDDSPISEQAIRRLGASPAVADFGRYISRYWPDADGVQRLSAQSLSAQGRESYEFMSPWDEDRWAQWAAEPLALISEPLARRLDLSPGDAISLPGPGLAPVNLTVAAVFADYRADGGRAIVHLDQYRRLWQDPTITSLALYFEHGQGDAAVAQIRQQVDELNQDSENALEWVQTGDLRRRSLEVFDQTFQLTRGLKWLAAIVAFVGVLSAILALQLERRRELSLLHAMGLVRGQIATLLMLESLGLGLAAALLAMPLGAALAWLLTGVVNTRAFGWTLYVDWQWTTFVLGGAIAVAAALLAAVPPAVSFKSSRGAGP